MGKLDDTTQEMARADAEMRQRVDQARKQGQPGPWDTFGEVEKWDATQKARSLTEATPKLNHWEDSTKVAAQRAKIASKEAALADAERRYKAHSERIESSAESLAELGAFVAVGRRSVKELDAAKATVEKLRSDAEKARGEMLTLAEELRADRFALGLLEADACAESFELNLAQRTELCERAEVLALELAKINSRLTNLRREATRNFPAGGGEISGSEAKRGRIRQIACVPVEGGYTVPLECNAVHPGAVTAWQERWRSEVAAAKRVRARLKAEAEAKAL